MGDSLLVLADRLGVDVETLQRLRCGWDQVKSQWTFPERDGQGNIVGMSTRLLVPVKDRDGKTVTKRMIRGSRHGLFYDPDGWDTGSGPIVLVEGASDTASAMLMGIPAIGRPSNRGGVDYITEMLRGIATGRQIIVVGERDDKPDGSSPGRDGAIQTAQRLSESLGRQVTWSLPPKPYKDTREFLSSQGKDAGKQYLAALVSAGHDVSIAAPHAEPVAAQQGPARTLKEWREEAASHREEIATTPVDHLDRSPTGGGKTYNAIETLKLVDSSLMVLPTHANCQERVEEMKAQGVEAVAYPALTKETCHRYEEAAEVQRLGLSVGQTICRGCQFAADCPYQRDRKAAENARHRVATHEHLRTSKTVAYQPKKKGEEKGKPVDLVVIDEMPTDVLAPFQTISIQHIEGVRTLARSIAYANYIERDEDQQRFAESLLSMLDRVDEASRTADKPGRHPVEIGGQDEPPKDWQWLLLKSIRKVGRRSFEPKALKLITWAVTGKLSRLDIVTDITTRKVKQSDGTEIVQQIPHQYLVGRFTPDIPETIPRLLLDATARAEDIEAATGRPVTDHTPKGHLERRQRAVQITDDITRDTSPRKVAAHIVRHLIGNPEVQELGVIGHSVHVSQIEGLLPDSFRKRLAKVAYFGQGPDRGSNDWHKTCDHLLVLGTPRQNPGDLRRWLVQHGLDEAAALPEGDWGNRSWQGIDSESGKVVEVVGRGNRHPDWHRAHNATNRASLLQAIGRGRVLLDNGRPVTVISSEPTGLPVAPAGSNLPGSVVSTVQSMETLAGQIERERTDISPISNTYRENVGSDLPAELCIAALMEDHAIGKRQAERRLSDAVACGVIHRPKRGWYRFGPADDAPAPAATEPPQGVAGPVAPPDTVVVTATAPAAPTGFTITVSADICPLNPTPRDEMQGKPEPPEPDLTEADRQHLFDERAAIMEHEGGMDRKTADRLAAEAIYGRDAAAAMFDGIDENHMVAAAVERFPGEIQRLPQVPPRVQNRQSAVAGTCRNCGHDRFTDHLVHGGRSIRRDCARCESFYSFPHWNPAGYDPRPGHSEAVAIQSVVVSSIPVSAYAPVIAGDAVHLTRGATGPIPGPVNGEDQPLPAPGPSKQRTRQPAGCG